MENIIKMTSQQLRDEMQVLSKYFTCIRLLDGNLVPRKEFSVLAGEDGAPCYHIWKRDMPCRECVARKALEENTTRHKLETREDILFEVTAKYLELDGEGCVLELVKEVDDDFLANMDTDWQPKKQLADYYEKIYQDVLTGAYNRRFYEERMKTSRMVAGVAFIDIDDFKLYNDVYGHATGDEVLRVVVREIRSCIRRQDKVIRYGGDEFLVIMPHIEPDVFMVTLDKIRSHINRAKPDKRIEGAISVSIGAVYSGNEMMDGVVNRADDLLLHRAKKEKNSIITEKDVHVGTAKEKASILIVDDSEINREILMSILENEFHILEASSGDECIACLRQQGSRIAVVLLDVVMPGRGGFEVLSYMNVHRMMEEIPVIMITGDESDDTVRRAYEMGVSDYIRRPFDVKTVYRRVMNTIQLYSKQRRLIKRVTEQMLEKESDTQMLIAILSQIAEFRHVGGGEYHISRIRTLTRLLLERLVMRTEKYALNARDIDLIANASALHDIGKIAVREEILTKRGPLTPEEAEVLREHTVIGADMLWQLREYRHEKLLQYAWQICRYHHERYNGVGYPDGLVGEATPIAAQVVALCDAYDELVSHRAYREAQTHEEAMRGLLEKQRDAFQPLLLECFRDMAGELPSLYRAESDGEDVTPRRTSPGDGEASG